LKSLKILNLYSLRRQRKKIAVQKMFYFHMKGTKIIPVASTFNLASVRNKQFNVNIYILQGFNCIIILGIQP
jgi:hypothetical protein